MCHNQGIEVGSPAADRGEIIQAVIEFVGAVGQRNRQAYQGDHRIGAPQTIAEMSAVTDIDLAQIGGQRGIGKGTGTVNAGGFQTAIGQAGCVGGAQVEPGRRQIVVQVFINLDDGGTGLTLPCTAARQKIAAARTVTCFLLIIATNFLSLDC